MMLTFCIGTSGRKNRLSSFLVYSGNCLINLSKEERYVLGFEARLPEWHRACPTSPRSASGMLQGGKQDLHCFQPLFLPPQHTTKAARQPWMTKLILPGLLNLLWSSQPSSNCKRQLPCPSSTIIFSHSIVPCIFASLVFYSLEFRVVHHLPSTDSNPDQIWISGTEFPLAYFCIQTLFVA